MEDKGLDWTIANLTEYLHGVDIAADELNETMYEKFSKEERFKKSADFMENLKRKTEMQRLIDEETFWSVQKIREGKRRLDSLGEPNALSGMLFCGDCGHRLYLCRQRDPHQKDYFVCSVIERSASINVKIKVLNCVHVRILIS